MHPRFITTAMHFFEKYQEKRSTDSFDILQLQAKNLLHIETSEELQALLHNTKALVQRITTLNKRTHAQHWYRYTLDLIDLLPIPTHVQEELYKKQSRAQN